MPTDDPISRRGAVGPMRTPVRTMRGVAARAGIVALAFVLGACAFRPLYGESESGAFARTQTQDIRVAEPGVDRTAQQVRNALIDRLTPRGEPAAPAYVLEFSITEAFADLLVQQNAEVLRRNLQLTGTYLLRDVSDGSVVYRGSATRSAALNRLDSEYANVIAERDARERAAESLADAIALRLGVVMATVQSPEGRRKAALERAAAPAQAAPARQALPPDLPGLTPERAPGVAKPPVAPVDTPPAFETARPAADADPEPAPESPAQPDGDAPAEGQGGRSFLGFPAPQAVDPSEL